MVEEGRGVADERARRKEAFKELGLLMSAKANINGILLSTYSIIFVVQAGLFYGVSITTIPPVRVALALLGIVALTALLSITHRSQATNSRCDSRAAEIETRLGIRVIRNYQPTSRWEFSLHSTFKAVDVVLIVLWIGLLVAVIPI